MEAKESKKVGETVEPGELLLLTSGSYSDFGVIGLYRAKQRFVVPGKLGRYDPHTLAPNIDAVASNPALVDEVIYTVLWRD